MNMEHLAVQLDNALSLLALISDSIDEDIHSSLVPDLYVKSGEAYIASLEVLSHYLRSLRDKAKEAQEV